MLAGRCDGDGGGGAGEVDDVGAGEGVAFDDEGAGVVVGGDAGEPVADLVEWACR